MLRTDDLKAMSGYVSSNNSNNNNLQQTFNTRQQLQQQQSQQQPAFNHSTMSAANLNGTLVSGNPVDALPKPFVASMKTLFDILDDRRTGFVRFADIEKGWQEDTKGLPRGVLDSLRKLTPSSGLLSFERFCAGLKLCLLRNQAETTHNVRRCSTNFNENYLNEKLHKAPMKVSRPPSAPVLEIENPLPNAPWHNNSSNTNNNNSNSSNNTSSSLNASLNHSLVQPHGSLLTTQRTLSMPQLSPDSSELEAEMHALNLSQYNSLNTAPPKPPRANTSTLNSSKKAGIRNTLQNWQMGLLLNEMDASDCHNIKRRKSTPAVPSTLAYLQSRGSADGGSSSATDSHHTISVTSADVVPSTMMITHGKKTNGNSNKRREARRHTLQNGIDYNLLKRLKLYEEEREVLFMGLDAVEKARNWYLQRLGNVQEKISCLGRMGMQMEQWSEVQQERLNFQRARVLEVNHNLASLADTWESAGFPLHHFNPIGRSPTKQALASSNTKNGTATQQRKNPPPNNGNNAIYAIPPPSAIVTPANTKTHPQTSPHFSRDYHIRRLERENRVLMHELYAIQQQKQHYLRQQQLQQQQHHQRHHGYNRSLSLNQPQASPVCCSTSSGGVSGELGDADVVY